MSREALIAVRCTGPFDPRMVAPFLDQDVLVNLPGSGSKSMQPGVVQVLHAIVG